MDIIIISNVKYVEIDDKIYNYKWLSIKNLLNSKVCSPKLVFKPYPQGLEKSGVVSACLFKPVRIVKELPSDELHIKYGVVISIIDNNDDNNYILYGFEIRLFDKKTEALEFSKQYEAIQ